MYDYAELPTLVLNEIFGYLSVKERIKAKSVCRTWREEIELREQKSDTLVLHLGPYPWNVHWTETNNRRLMKFENSFKVKNLDILEHPLSRELLNKTKKLAILRSFGSLNSEYPTIEPCLSYFGNCEVIEIRDVFIGGELTFELDKLRVLVFNNSSVDKLVLNCPSLEMLFLNKRVNEIDFQNVKKLKRLICFGWPETVSLDGKVFESLEYLNLNLTVAHEPVNDRLLDRMSMLKRLVIYSNNLQADLEIIREQQKRFGLKNLEVLFDGFRGPVRVASGEDTHEVMHVDKWLSKLFENYSKLEESSLCDTTVDYSKLFNKFKILPSNFFERFPQLATIEITQVTNYTHLFGFLKCCPFVQQLNIHLNSKVDANLILCQIMPLLHPSLKHVAIVEECPSAVLKIDLAFLRLFHVAALRVETTRISAQFIRKVAARKGPYLQSIAFEMSTTGRYICIFFPKNVLLLLDDGQSMEFPTVDPLISHMKSDPYLRSLLL